MGRVARFEDNVGALELANAHKLRPRTKHLSVQLHHFRQYVLDRKVSVEKICTTHQRADMFAKALPRDAASSQAGLHLSASLPQL